MEKPITIYSLKEAEKYKNELKKIKIWVCNTACGKSYLSAIDDRFFDLDYYRHKLHHGGIENYNELTIPMMEQKIKEGKVILNAHHTYFLDYLVSNKIPFVYLYGGAFVQDEYIRRMKHRGSSEEFINLYGMRINEWYCTKTTDTRGTFKIEMSEKDFVSDYA